MKKIHWVLLSLSLVFFSCYTCAGDNGWQQYKQAFVLPDGRIIDSGNNNVSHSEGQGYGMLLAVFNDDKQTFASIWYWTERTLYRNDVGLFSWRYDPHATVAIADPNTASDGDTLIAWALLLAGQKWNDEQYLSMSNQIQASLIDHVIVCFGDNTVMLPGVEGFEHRDRVTLNPSYFIFPAWHDFYEYSHNEIWQKLIDSSMIQLNRMKFGDNGLPTDWVDLDLNGQFSPAVGWPSRFSFDAVRIPLYLRWAGMTDETLAPYIKYWSKSERNETPAWTDVMKNETATYHLTQGMMAIRDLTLDEKTPISATLGVDEDYYSSSLHLLSYYVQKRQSDYAK